MKYKTLTYINHIISININYQKKGTFFMNLNIKDTFQIKRGFLVGSFLCCFYMKNPLQNENKKGYFSPFLFINPLYHIQYIPHNSN